MQLGESNKNFKITKILQAAVLTRPLVKKVSRLLFDINADILITNGIKCHIIGAIINKRYPIPLIWYLRDGLEGRRFSLKALKFYSSRCSATIAISHFISGEVRRFLPKTVPIHVLYNIIDLNKFKPGLPYPSDLIKRDGEIWYGMIGALTPLKGQDLFLEAAKQVLKSIPNARFIIVGTNFYKTESSLTYEKDLQLQTQFHPLKDRVNFLGFRNDIPQILSTFDVLVQPNRGPEGLGRSVIEAMACGVPVLAVDRWGPAELVKDFQTGILFPWMDVETLSEKMVLLGKEVQLRKKIGDNAREWVHQNLIPGEIADKFINILNDITSKSLKVNCN
jgi:glycosyltransferase involved in cell wall biosynthesis